VTEGDELVGGADAGAQGGVKGAAEVPRGRAGSGEVDGGQQERAHPPRGVVEGNDEQAAGGVGGNRGGAGGGGGRKNGEPDLEEKFGRFEIKPPSRSGGHGGHNTSLMGAAGSEQGDETVSMVSDTWCVNIQSSTVWLFSLSLKKMQEPLGSISPTISSPEILVDYFNLG